MWVYMDSIYILQLFIFSQFTGISMDLDDEFSHTTFTANSFIYIYNLILIVTRHLIG